MVFCLGQDAPCLQVYGLRGIVFGIGKRSYICQITRQQKHLILTLNLIEEKYNDGVQCRQDFLLKMTIVSTFFM